MRTTIFITLVLSIPLLCLFCCATKQPVGGSAMQELQKALVKGQDYSATGLVFEGDLDFNKLFAQEAGKSVYIKSQLRFTPISPQKS